MDLINRQDAIDAMYQLEVEDIERYGCSIPEGFDSKLAIEALKILPSTEPKRKKMSNKEWVDFLSEQFTVSRTSAKEMLHAMMSVKREDNFKKQFSGRK